MKQAVILSAVRAPIGKFQGMLSPFPAPELGAKVVAEAVRRAGRCRRRSGRTVAVGTG